MRLVDAARTMRETISQSQAALPQRKRGEKASTMF
jgi:hypothetical protein